MSRGRPDWRNSDAAHRMATLSRRTGQGGAILADGARHGPLAIGCMRLTIRFPRWSLPVSAGRRRRRRAEHEPGDEEA